MPRPLADAALAYAGRVRIFPLWGITNGRCDCGRSCDSPGKHPLSVLVQHGVLDATSDPEQVRRWWAAYPNANIGAAMGDLVAIDEDQPGSLMALDIEIPNCSCQRTGLGHHYIFKANGHPVGNRQKFAPGLDCRGDGGYIVVAPSLHASGRRYEWIAGHSLEELEPPDIPSALAALTVRFNGAAGEQRRDQDLFGRLRIEAILSRLESMPQRREGGGWREPMLRLVAFLVGRGMPDEVILALCRRATWTEAGYTHADTDAWVLDCIKSTRQRWNIPEPDEETFDQNDAELAAERFDETRARLRLVRPSEMDWRGAQLNLVKDLIGFGMMALLYGESGSAKTLIALSLALHIALGREWCGRKVRQGAVVYLAPEGAHSVHLRFHAWCRHHGMDPTKDSLPFRTIPTRVDLCASDADLEGVIANIKDAQGELGPCVLIVVDTVSRALAGGNENAPDDMGRFVGNCDRLREEIGATVIAVHHTPKGGDTPRGHGSLKNGAEIRLMARKVADGLFALETEHLKDGPTGEELLFNLHSAVVGQNDDGEDVLGGLVVRAMITAAGAAGNPHGKLTDRQLRILQELSKEAATTKRWEFSTEEFGDLCVRSGAVDSGASENVQRARCSDLRRQLANKGYISIAGDTIRLVHRG